MMKGWDEIIRHENGTYSVRSESGKVERTQLNRLIEKYGAKILRELMKKALGREEIGEKQFLRMTSELVCYEL